jgi:hypothetical protein
MMIAPDLLAPLLGRELVLVFDVLVALGVGALGVWTTPRTWVAGEIVTAAQMNLHVRDNLVDLDLRMDTAVQELQEEVTSLDGNGSIVLTTEATSIVLNGAGTADVNGMSVPVRAPWQASVINITSNVATLKHEDATEPTPAKRFRLPGDTDLALSLGEGVTFKYISVPAGARWVAVVAA